METTNHTVAKPKTQKAALKQAGQLTIILRSKEEKRMNIMKRVDEIKTKLEKLENELRNLEENSRKCLKDEAQYRERIEQLQLEFDFTEAQLLEIQTQLLQKQIKKLDQYKLTGVQDRPSDFS